MKSGYRIILIGVTVIIILAMVTIAGWFLIKQPPLIIQGEVEATQIKVGSKIAGRIKVLHVKEGEHVKKGQLLVTIDSPEIEAKLVQVAAAEKAAKAQRKKAFKGTREERIRSSKNVWKKAQTATDLAQKTFNRIERLYADGVIPAQKRDESEAGLKAARQTEEAARATYEMAVKGVRKEDKDAAAAMAEKASGAVSEVKAYLQETRLVAPIKSEVTGIIAESGELISPGYPIVTLVDLGDVWITFNLRENLLSKIRMGSILQARFPALGNREIVLKVNYITALGDYATWRATKTSGDFDLKTFEVRAAPVKPLCGLRPGMSAIVNWEEVPQNQSE